MTEKSKFISTVTYQKGKRIDLFASSQIEKPKENSFYYNLLEAFMLIAL